MKNMAASSDKKSFGHCKVEWRFDNFPLQIFSKEWVFQSPEFTIRGSEETNWIMVFRSELINETKCAVFNLRRLAIDSGPKYVWLNLKMNYIVSNERYTWCSDKLLCLKNDSKYVASLGTIKCLLSNMNESDTLFTIECHMIVYSDRTITEFGECSNEGINLLSKNMLDLYRSSQHFDTILKFADDDTILVHKAILVSRNAYLRSRIVEQLNNAEDPDYMTINFTDRLDFTGMRKTIAYLYTGDIRHVIEEPSLAIYHCASVLGITEVKSYYEPDKLIFKSTIDIQEYTYFLPGCTFLNSRFRWCSDQESSTKTYQLLLYPRRENTLDFIPLFSNTFEKPLIASLEFHFVEKNCVLCICSLTTVVDGCFDIDDRIIEIMRKLHSTHNIFEIIIKLKLTTNMRISHIDEHSCAFVSYVNNEMNYKRFGIEIWILFYRQTFSDVLINDLFRVHKCILASRSPFFSDMLKNVGEEILIPNIDEYVMHVVLAYIYSGMFTIQDDLAVIDAYKTAVLFNLPQLKSMCSELLNLSCRNDTEIRCLAVRLAEEYGDGSLLKSVLNSFFDEIFS